MSPFYSLHRSGKTFHRSPSGDSTLYSTPEHINVLASPKPRSSSSPFSVGTTPIKTRVTSIAQSTASKPFSGPEYDEPYSPPSDIATMREFDLLQRTNNPYLRPSNFAAKSPSLHQPNANLRTLRHIFDSLIAATSTSTPLSTWDVDGPPRREVWSTFLLSLELEREELRNALLYLAKHIAYNTLNQAEVEGEGAGMLSGSPLHVFTWEDLVQGDWIERMSSMLLRSRILQGVIRLEELTAGSRVEGEGKRTESVRCESMGGDRGGGYENVTRLEPEEYEQPCRAS